MWNEDEDFSEASANFLETDKEDDNLTENLNSQQKIDDK